jgi:capsular polysaccharide biosynthesis protein
MELRRLWLLVWQRKYFVLLCLVAALAAGYLTTPRDTRYSATSTLFVGAPTASADQQVGQQDVASTFATMIPTFAVATAAEASAHLSLSVARLVGETRAAVVYGTTLIHITVTDPDPLVAQAAANAMGNAFVAEIAHIYGISGASSGTGTSPLTPLANNSALAVMVSLSQPALLPVRPDSEGLSRNLALSGIFGLVVAIGLVLLLDYLDLSVRSPADLEQRLGLPVLGVIPLFPRLPASRSVVPSPPHRVSPPDGPRADGHAAGVGLPGGEATG